MGVHAYHVIELFFLGVDTLEGFEQFLASLILFGRVDHLLVDLSELFDLALHFLVRLHASLVGFAVGLADNVQRILHDLLHHARVLAAHICFLAVNASVL